MLYWNITLRRFSLKNWVWKVNEQYMQIYKPSEMCVYIQEEEKKTNNEMLKLSCNELIMNKNFGGSISEQKLPRMH